MKEKMERIGHHILVPMDNGMMIECEIINYKFTFGNERWQVKPVAGTGTAWVQKFSEINQ